MYIMYIYRTHVKKKTANRMMNETEQSWNEIVPFTPLGPGYLDTCHTYVPVKDQRRYTHIRFNMFPDGGIATDCCWDDLIEVNAEFPCP